MRLDKYLFAMALAPSRSRAGQLIRDGAVTVNGKTVLKLSAEVGENDRIEVTDSIGYVGRGGLKLEKALETFGVSPSGKTALDIGASTGGFTQCLLNGGASHVFAIDVGKGQLASSLASDARVTLLENTNARYLTVEQIGNQTADMAVMDVSFISQTLLYPALFACVKAEGPVITLVKPQFEAGVGGVTKKGICRPEYFESVFERIVFQTRENGRRVCGFIPSPVLGGDGNREFLALLLSGDNKEISVKEMLETL